MLPILHLLLTDRPSLQHFGMNRNAEPDEIVWSTQMAPLADLFNQPVPAAAWKHKPAPYIIGSSDRTIQPELQRFLAARMKAKVTELASSHVPMLSQPQGVYDVIVDAAANIAGRSSSSNLVRRLHRGCCDRGDSVLPMPARRPYWHVTQDSRFQPKSTAGRLIRRCRNRTFSMARWPRRIHNPIAQRRISFGWHRTWPTLARHDDGGQRV